MSKNKIFIVLMAMLMVFSSFSVVLAAGSSSSVGGKPFSEGNNQTDYKEKEDTYSKGEYSSWVDKNKALVVDNEYSNTLIYRKSSSKDVQLIGITANGPRSFRGGNEYNTSTKKWERNADYPQVDISDMHSINLKGKSGGDVSFLYRNYHYLNPDTKKWDNLDIKVTITSFTHVPSKSTRYSGIMSNPQAVKEGAETGFEHQYTVTDPIMFISKKCYGGFPRFDMFNIGDLQLRTEFFKAGTTTPQVVKSNVTYGDIDGWQCMSFRTETTDYTYAASNTNLLYTRDKTSLGNWYATFSDPTGDNLNGFKDPNASRHAVAFAYNSDTFYTVYGSGQQKGKSEKKGDGWVSEAIYDQGNASGRDSYFTTSQYSMVIPNPSAPQKFVFDDNEPARNAGETSYDVMSKYSEENYLPIKNEIESLKKPFVYVVAQQVPAGMGIHEGGGFTYDSFVLEDQVDNALVIDQSTIAVYRDTFANDYGPANETDKFDISVSGNKITAKAKSSFLDDNAFYGSGRGSEILLTFAVTVNPNADLSKYLNPKIKKYVFENEADSSISIGSHYWDHVPSNKVTTLARLPKPKKNAPVKEVSDNDNKTLTGTGAEKNVKENTIEKADDIYTYHVKHTVKDRDGKIPYASYWYFNSYKISDKVEDLLLIQDGAKVYEGSNDVTGKFDIAVSSDRKNITATAKVAELAKEDFYEKTYELRFNVRIDTQKYKTESDLAKWATENNKGAKGILLKWPNKATVNITDPVDPDDPNSEDGKGTWQKDTNNVYTNLWNPAKGDKPGLEINKTTDPYEFQVGENIPYTITIKQTNPDAVAYLVEAEDTDLPEGFVIDKESIKAEGGTDPSATVEGERNIKIAAKYLRYGETLKVTFTGKAEKTLNGKVVPNEVIGRAWGTHENDKSTWDRDHTSVYINSPKLNIVKEDMSKKHVYKAGDVINYKATITNVNPGTFMRHLYTVDVSETDGLSLDKSSIVIKNERNVTLKEGTDYRIETWDDGQNTMPMDNIGYEGKDYTIETSKETAENTGDELPNENHGGFYIRFMGKYRNMGYDDKTIPATNDERGKVVTYLTEDLRNLEAEHGINYTKDYENLNLQGKLILSYNMKVDNDLAGTNINNFIRVPATLNTNGIMINNDDKIPSGGDFARTNETIEEPIVDNDKEVEEDWAEEGKELHYTLTGENTSRNTAKDIVIEDEVKTQNFTYKQDSLKIIFKGEDITNDVKITFSDETSEKPFSFKIETGRNFEAGEKFTVTYSGTVIGSKEDLAKKFNVKTGTVYNTFTLSGSNFKPIEADSEVSPPPQHVKSVKENQHDGPEGQINELHYTLNSKNDTDSTLKNVVITDEILTNNLVYNEDVKIALNGEDVTDKVKITYVKDSTNPRFIIETGMDLAKGDEFVTTYSGKVTNKNVVHNETVLTADDFGGIRDEKTVPGPEPCPLLRAVKSSEPVTGTEVGVGDKIKYIIELENYGDADAEKAVIRDYVPVGTKFVSAENEGKYSDAKTDSANDKGNGYVDWYPLTVKAGEKIKVVYTVEVTKDALKTKVVENQALYQNDFDPKKGKDPSSTTNIVEHPISEEEPTTPEEPVIVDEPEEPQEESKNDTAIEHNKAVKESVTAKDKILHYELTTNILTAVEDVIITDEVTSKNLAYNKSSIKVYYNGDDITKNVEIQMKEHSFLIETGIDAIQDDEFKVVYEGKATDNKTVKNSSSAYGKDVDPVKSSVKVDPAKTDLSHEKKKAESKPKSNSGAKTGDNMPIGIAAALLIISAIVAMILLFKRRGI